MNQDLKNKVINFWDANYNKHNFGDLLSSNFTEEEMYIILSYPHPHFSDMFFFVKEVLKSDYCFNSRIIYQKIVNNISDSDEMIKLKYLCSKLNNEYLYKFIEMIASNDIEDWMFNETLLSVITYQSDSFKEKLLIDGLLKKKNYVDLIFDVVVSMKNDWCKMRCLKYLAGYYKSKVISSFSSDSLKENCLNLLSDDKEEIILSINSDDIKVRNLKKYWYVLSAESRGRIIGSIKDKELLYFYARSLKSGISKAKVIEQVSDLYPDLCFELLKTIVNQEAIADAVCAMGCTDEVYMYASKIKREEYIVDMFSKCDSCISDQILHMISNCNGEFLKSELPRLRHKKVFYLVLPYINDFSVVTELIDHTEDLIEYSDDIEPLVSRYAKEYNVNKEHLLTMITRFGLSMLRVVKNKNIINLLNLNDKDFDKMLQIFDVNNFQMTDSAYNDSINALLQRKFRVFVPNIVMLFPFALQAIETGNKKELQEMLDELSNTLSEEEVYSTLRKKEFVDKLILKDDNAIDYLHTLTSKYIKLKRNEYVKANISNVKNRTMLLKYDKSRTLKLFLQNSSISYLMKLFENFCDDDYDFILSEEEKSLLSDYEKIRNILRYRKNPRENKELLSDIKSDLRLFDTICDRLLDEYVLNDFAAQNGLLNNYVYRDINLESIISIMMELDVDKLKEGILSDDVMFQKMMKQLKQFSFLGWNDVFSELALEAGISINFGVIANFIVYYSVIYNELNDRMVNKNIKSMTFTSFLDYASCFDSSSKRYSLLFDSDDFNLIVSNPIPQSSSSSKDERIRSALEYLKVIRNRTKITIPTMDENFKLKNGKVINVNIGNFSDSINLTYGERTGACMRIGGAGDSLFDFCLRNENGFHIRFSDPVNGEFISRVSGFRNGNTVFLNQLRFSVNSNYSDLDVVEACRSVAEMLIELSKDSVTPIDNVVISNEYSMEKTDDEVINLGVRDIKMGLKESFYSDVDSSAILLASSAPNKGLVPVVLGNSANKDRYGVLRRKPKMYLESDGIDKILQIELIDQYLSGVSIEDLVINNYENMLFCYVGEDWYIKVNMDKTIDVYIMKNSINLSAAEEEVNNVKSIINEQVQIIDSDSVRM